MSIESRLNLYVNDGWMCIYRRVGEGYFDAKAKKFDRYGEESVIVLAWTVVTMHRRSPL